MVKLMQQHLSENGVEVIDHNHIEQARNQMRETYRWAGEYSPTKMFTLMNFKNLVWMFQDMLWGRISSILTSSKLSLKMPAMMS